MRTNNGDDRMKAHDVFPAVCYPDLFWKLAEEDIDAELVRCMCPHEIADGKGLCAGGLLPARSGSARYRDCVADARISKRVVTVKELVRLILKIRRGDRHALRFQPGRRQPREPQQPSRV